MISREVAQNLQNASWIRKMFEEGDRLRREFGPENVFDFSLGNPQEEPPAIVRETLAGLAAAPPKGMHRYMSNAGFPETRKAVAEVISCEIGTDFPADCVLMTNGAAGGLNVTLRALLDPGDEVIVLSPYFVEYLFYVRNSQGAPVVCPTGQEDFLPRPEDLEEALSERTKALIINSPNNPTGVVYPDEVLGKLSDVLAAAERKTGKPVYVISDEPYKRIVYDNIRVPEIFNIFPNSVVVNSYSKSLGLAGERIGYTAVNPQAQGAGELMEALVFCQRTLGFVNAPALPQRLIQEAATAQVEISGYQAKRDLLYGALKKSGFRCVKPDGAFYLFPATPGDEMDFIRSAQELNLLFVPGRGFGCPGHFRISYCVDEGLIERAIPVIEKLASRHF